MKRTTGPKKIVHASTDTRPSIPPAGRGTGLPLEPDWTPSIQSRSRARLYRVVAASAWTVAIVAELVAMTTVLRQVPPNLSLLLGILAAIGTLSITGSLLWKRSNALDPASKSETVRFFIQNQLGAMISVVAFLPLIWFVITSKNLTPKQKTVVGGFGSVIAAIAVIVGTSWSPPSVEQYANESSIVTELTGQDLVFWTRSGQVFHLCAAVPDVNRESQDGQIYEGTVAEAHAAGKERLTMKWAEEAVDHCGYSQAQVNAVRDKSTTTRPTISTPS